MSRQSPSKRLRIDWRDSTCKRLSPAVSSHDIVFLDEWNGDSTGARRWPQGAASKERLERFRGKIAGVVEAELANMFHEVACECLLDRVFKRRACSCHDEKG